MSHRGKAHLRRTARSPQTESNRGRPPPRSSLTLLATVRVRQIEVLSVACARLDAESGVTLLALVKSSVERGALSVIVDFGPTTFIDLDGALAVGTARARLGDAGSLVLSGLSPRARAVLLAAGVAGSVRMVDWWTDAVEPATRVA
jgi:hypothetical protein